jgi:hypothetical protein
MDEWARRRAREEGETLRRQRVAIVSFVAEPSGPALALVLSTTGRKERTMRIEEATAAKGSKNRLVGTVMGLALASGALLSMGGSPARHATSSVGAATPAAAVLASTTSDSLSPRDAIADKAVLDLQLD